MLARFALTGLQLAELACSMIGAIAHFFLFVDMAFSVVFARINSAQFMLANSTIITRFAFALVFIFSSWYFLSSFKLF